MKNLSAYRQVISVTHLAQIAALADEHFLVEKETDGDSTLAKIKKLEKNEKVIEVAKLLSGGESHGCRDKKREGTDDKVTLKPAQRSLIYS